MLIGRADTSKMLAPARGIIVLTQKVREKNILVLSDTESLMTLWNDFNFALTEPQKDYLNEQNEFKLLTLKINDLDKAIKLTK